MLGQTLPEVLAVFGRSDLSGVTDPLWWVFMASIGSHVLIGLMLAKAPQRLAWGIVAALVAKEGAFDIPQAEGAALVVLDSLADVAAVLIGLLAGRRFWRKPAT